MAPLAPNSTDFYSLVYTSGGQEHKLNFRTKPTATVSQAMTFAGNLIAILDDFMYTADTFLRLDRRAQGAQHTFTVAGMANTGLAAGAPTAGQAANFISWTGRSVNGRDVRMTFFSGAIPENHAYRINRVDNTLVNAIITLLDNSSAVICAIDGETVVWNQYANVGFNAYWQREARRS